MKKLANEVVEELNKLIPYYSETKSNESFYKKKAEESGKKIKSIFAENEIDEYEAGEVKAKVSIREKNDFNESALISKIKQLKMSKGIIKRKEYVDMEALENAIYKGDINAIDLADCQTKKEVAVLVVSKIKR